MSAYAYVYIVPNAAYVANVSVWTWHRKENFRSLYAEFMNYITYSEAQVSKQILKSLQWQALILWKKIYGLFNKLGHLINKQMLPKKAAFFAKL